MARISGTRRDDWLSPTRFMSDDEPAEGPRPTDGVDEVYGGDGDDTIDAGQGADEVFGGEDNDELRSYSRLDSLYGGEGDDLLLSLNGGDSLYGGEGDDILRRLEDTEHAILFSGGDDEDLIEVGRSVADTINGGAGNDTIVATALLGSRIDGGEGVDILSLGSGGIDLADARGLGINADVTFENIEGAIIRRGGGQIFGDDFDNYLQVDGTQDGTLLDGREGDDVLQGSEGADSLRGSDGDDTVYGGSGADHILATSGDTGRDAIFGGDGNDRIQLGSGDAVIDGGAGVDSIAIAGSRGQVVTMAGTDTLRLTSVEILYAGGGADTITGSGRNDSLHGREGADVLVGGAGMDALYGGLGNDRLTGSAGDRLFGGDGNDTVRGVVDLLGADGGQGRDTIDLSTMATGFALDLATGIASFAGRRLIEFERVLGGTGGDTISGGSDWNVLFGGEGGDILQGRDGSDSLHGGGGRDSLQGGRGDDILEGGLGIDRLTGGEGGDTFVFRNLTSGPSIDRADRITDFERPGAAAGDRIDVSAMDARADQSGDQAFVVGSARHGGLWLTTAGTDTVVLVNTDSDTEAEARILIADGAVSHTAYTAADFIL